MLSLTDTAGSRQPRSDGELTREHILDLLREYRASGAESPSTIEIARRLKISRTNTKHHLGKLKAEGLISFRASTRKVPCTRVDLIEPGTES